MAIVLGGDINSDGMDDFLVGVLVKNGGNGVVYVVYGNLIIGIWD